MPGRNQPRSRRGRSAIARTAMNTNSTNGLGINNGGGMKKGGAHPSATGFMRSKPWQISVPASRKNYAFKMKVSDISVDGEHVSNNIYTSNTANWMPDPTPVKEYLFNTSQECANNKPCTSTMGSGCLMEDDTKTYNICCVSPGPDNSGCGDFDALCVSGASQTLCNKSITKSCTEPVPATQKMLMAYYGQWTTYPSAGGYQIPLTSNPLNKITHLAYGFMGFNNKGEIGSWDYNADFRIDGGPGYGSSFFNAISASGLGWRASNKSLDGQLKNVFNRDGSGITGHNFYRLGFAKLINPKLKIIMSFGGWEYQKGGSPNDTEWAGGAQSSPAEVFYEIASTQNVLTNFCTQIKNFIENFKFVILKDHSVADGSNNITVVPYQNLKSDGTADTTTIESLGLGPDGGSWPPVPNSEGVWPPPYGSMTSDLCSKWTLSGEIVCNNNDWTHNLWKCVSHCTCHWNGSTCDISWVERPPSPKWVSPYGPSMEIITPQSISDDNGAFRLFDGADIDWEYPTGCGNCAGCGGTATCPDGWTPTTQQQSPHYYAKLLTTLKNTLGNLEVSTTTPGGPGKISNILNESADVAKAYNIIDHVNIMSYDFMIGKSYATHDAPLKNLQIETSEGIVDWNADATVKVLTNAGVHPNKISLGAPYYGRFQYIGPSDSKKSASELFTGKVAAQSKYFAAAVGLLGDGAKQNSIDYGKFSQYKSNFNIYPDNTNGVDYYISTNTVSVNGTQQNVLLSMPTTNNDGGIGSIEQKASYIKDNNLGGIITWMMSQDDTKYTLTNTLYDNLGISTQ